MPLVDSLNIKVLQVLQHSQDYITHVGKEVAGRGRFKLQTVQIGRIIFPMD